MSNTTRMSALRYALIAFGLTFLFGLVTFNEIWASGWRWGGVHSHYWPMIVGVYATLGVFLILASRDPLANRSLIWFTVLSSAVHALVMTGQAIMDPAERGHLVGDVPALLLVAIVLSVLMPKGATMTVAKDIGARRVA